MMITDYLPSIYCWHWWPHCLGDSYSPFSVVVVVCVDAFDVVKPLFIPTVFNQIHCATFVDIVVVVGRYGNSPVLLGIWFWLTGIDIIYLTTLLLRAFWCCCTLLLLMLLHTISHCYCCAHSGVLLLVFIIPVVVFCYLVLLVLHCIWWLLLLTQHLAPIWLTLHLCCCWAEEHPPLLFMLMMTDCPSEAVMKEADTGIQWRWVHSRVLMFGWADVSPIWTLIWLRILVTWICCPLHVVVSSNLTFVFVPVLFSRLKAHPCLLSSHHSFVNNTIVSVGRPHYTQWSHWVGCVWFVFAGFLICWHIPHLMICWHLVFLPHLFVCVCICAWHESPFCCSYRSDTWWYDDHSRLSRRYWYSLLMLIRHIHCCWLMLWPLRPTLLLCVWQWLVGILLFWPIHLLVTPGLVINSLRPGIVDGDDICYICYLLIFVYLMMIPGNLTLVLLLFPTLLVLFIPQW